METKKMNKKKTIILLGLLTLIVVGVVGGYYWQTTKDQVYAEKAEVHAPSINLSTTGGGELKKIFVKEGDVVPANFEVAQIGDEIIKTGSKSLIVNLKNSLGEVFAPGQTVVTVINPDELQLIAQVKENKGLNKISKDQKVMFTVDAFDSEKFYGIVDEVAPSSRESGIAFSISDKREAKIFDVKIRFNADQYAKLKNGMSAKAWIFTK
jgi:multidrug resistance efflux pump